MLNDVIKSQWVVKEQRVHVFNQRDNIFVAAFIAGEISIPHSRAFHQIDLSYFPVNKRIL